MRTGHPRQTRTPQPGEPDRYHAAVESGVGLLKSAVRHMEVTVLEDQGPLGREKVLQAYTSLREELRAARELGRLGVECGMNRTRAGIDVRQESTHRLQPEAKEKGSPEQLASGMSRAAQNPFTDQLKALDRKP